MPRSAEPKGYDRARLLAKARKATARGSHRAAVALYAQVHRNEPENTDLLRRLAGQRARAGQREEAWRDCRVVVERLAKAGFVEQAIGACRDLVTYLPDSTEVWEAISDLELDRGRSWDAVAVLVEGRQRFRRRRHRSQALLLLQRARRIDPTHFAANFDLAGLLARGGARAQARRILEGLEQSARGRELRRLRARQLRLSPGIRTAGRWLAAVLRGR